MGDNTPTFNAGNRKIVNFKDFLADPKAEEQELKDIKRSFSDNENDQGLQQHKYKYNKVTHKLDDMVEDEVDDSLDAFEEGIFSDRYKEEGKENDRLYTKSEVIKLIQDFYIEDHSFDYNIGEPSKLNANQLSTMGKKVIDWMADK